MMSPKYLKSLLGKFVEVVFIFELSLDLAYYCLLPTTYYLLPLPTTRHYYYYLSLLPSAVTAPEGCLPRAAVELPQK
jgi:hypothetical protein